MWKFEIDGSADYSPRWYITESQAIKAGIKSAELLKSIFADFRLVSYAIPVKVSI